MISSTRASGVATAAAACVLATALAACAAPTKAAADAPAPVRVVVELVRGSGDGAAIAAEAASIAGVPVRYAAATSVTRHALFVACDSAAQCDAALARLRAAANTYRAVEIDGRKTRTAS